MGVSFFRGTPQNRYFQLVVSLEHLPKHGYFNSEKRRRASHKYASFQAQHDPPAARSPLPQAKGCDWAGACRSVGPRCLWSKPFWFWLIPFWLGLVRKNTHLRTYFSGWIGVFTIWVVTHGHMGMDQSSTIRGTGFSPCFHLAGFHVGYLFLTHGHINQPQIIHRRVLLIGFRG